MSVISVRALASDTDCFGNFKLRCDPENIISTGFLTRHPGRGCASGSTVNSRLAPAVFCSSGMTMSQPATSMQSEETTASRRLSK
jgi:hypothetical protein